ncbi:Cytochrome p450 [Thalictrum thalictroides]|uniref:Cytochrome p450 n=1 Tax=Thalictrum thalictroides TaxID=46969 RepID=A0A7J6X3L4_THATH|nr:Cytochrome p450 [Thalictrum thalictroides]
METSSIITVKGYHVPAKTRVFINIWSIHRDPSYWDRPEEFMPERFINKILLISKAMISTTFLSAQGEGGCPGMSFAMVVIKLAIANLLYCFDCLTGRHPVMKI